MVAETADRATEDDTWEPTPGGRARWLLRELGARSGGLREALLEDVFATAERATLQRALAVVADVAGPVVAARVRVRLLEAGR
jgi:hypothetical protein